MSFALRSSFKPFGSPACRACTRTWAIYGTRWSSTEAAPPPLLAKMKGELKPAMKSKDTPRLNVLRAIITDYNNASKSSTPITTDIQILSLLRRRKASSEEAEQEALQIERADIAAKQRGEINIMDEYLNSVQLMAEDEIKAIVQTVIDQIKSVGGDTKAGQVLKEIFKPSGALDGKPVERAQVAKLVNNLLSGK